MITVRLINYNKLLKSKKFIKTVFLNNTYATSTQPAVQNTEEQYSKELKDFDTLTNITRKPRTKKPQKPPFAKNLFLGIFDTDILTYPQLEKDEIDNLERDVAPLEKLLKQNHMVDCDTLSNKNFRQNLSDYKAIGLQASQFMDGKEYTISESSRILEVLSDHKLRDNIIYNEKLGVQTLVRFASDTLKKKYLHPLMKGELLSAFGMTEASLTDVTSLNTKARLSNDKKTWILNGEKTWVVNGVSADVLIVIALAEVGTTNMISETKLAAFVVEKGFPGVSCKQIDSDIEVANITFNETPVPAENLIGERNMGEKMLSSILTGFRLSTGPACITLTKKILNNLSKNILEQSNDRNILNETDAIREKIGEIATSLYAMESILYLTTGLMDSYEKQDCELESIIVKIFCSENCLNASLIALDLSGTLAISDSHWSKIFHKESLRYFTLHETNDSLKIIVALLGLQHAGEQLNELVAKVRNPFFFAGFALRRMFSNHRNINDNPKLDLGLEFYLHPSLIGPAKRLEYTVKRLQFITEVILSNHGSEVVNKHMDLRRLGATAIDVYAMVACIGRASRSYCIGLQDSNYELSLANNFCLQATERIRRNVQKIYSPQLDTGDETNRTLSKHVFKTKGYSFKHPLARNF